MATMIGTLDKTVFSFVNQTAATPFLDGFMLFITQPKNTWVFLVPVVVTLLIFKRKEALRVFLGVAVSVGLADLTAARVFKPLAHQSRPQFVISDVRLIAPSQSSYSFPSNHATNCFAAAEYLSFFFQTPWVRALSFLIASLVGYSRVYVGVHWPSDVVGGALLGICCAQFVGLAVVRRKKILGSGRS